MSRHGDTPNPDEARVVDFPPLETVQSQVAKWLAVLDSDDPPREKVEEFKAWINQNEEHRREFEAMLALWDEMNVLTQIVPPRRVAESKGRRGGGRFALGGWPGRALACCALLLVATVVLVATMMPSNVYVTEIGEQRTIRLADGTSVLLNTNSRIEVDYGDERRRVTLQRGEALFSVARDPVRPFEVHAGGGTIRALGTAFAVYMRGEDIEVLVTEGVVEIERSQPERQREAPEKAVANNDADKENPLHGSGREATGREAAVRGITGSEVARVSAGTSAVFGLENFGGLALAEVEKPRIDARLAWRHGVLAFDQERLEDVVMEMARYTSLKFVIPDKTLREMRVGGIFRLGDTEAMFEALQQGFGIRSDRVSDNLVYLIAADH